ncbi:hypothetical protein ACFFGV_00755 [Pontibacillus salicampi]|uniref:Uncharacterized protein n=1 Tax=Pontibacillus salicampi TaxID=1449801 RepID=A0ABV6LII6_9BACI
METIKAYLNLEYTGPTDKQSSLFDKGLQAPELDAYITENYEPLVANVDGFINKHHVLLYLMAANKSGYQLKPVHINIDKIESSEYDAYQYEVEVQHMKDEDENTTIVSGRMNLNEEGEISIIRNVDDNGLLDTLRKEK